MNFNIKELGYLYGLVAADKDKLIEMMGNQFISKETKEILLKDLERSKSVLEKINKGI